MRTLFHSLTTAVLLLGSLVARSTAESASAAARVPIVTAQGVVTFTGDPVDWRVYELEADPANPREAVTAAAGFTLVDDGGLIVLDANSGREALLGPGEASFSNDGDLLVINTEAGEPVTYRRIVLMPDDFADDASNPAAFESEAFAISSGKHEVELAIGMLAGEADSVPVRASDAGLGLIIALDAPITITSGGGEEAIEPGDYHALSNDVGITSMDTASFAVIRIGPPVRDVNQPLPPADEFTGDDDETVPPADDDVDTDLPATGTLTLQPQICGMGGSTGGCSNRPDAAVLEISGGGLGAPVYTSEIAPNPDGTYTLTDLPYGEYVIQNLDLGKGDFEIDGGYQDPSQPGVYVVTISADNPQPVLSVRLLPPVGEGTISVELYVCPDGLPGTWAQPWFCPAQLDGWSLSLTSDAFAGSLGTWDAPATSVGYTFPGLPVGYEYRLSVDAFPADYPLVWVDPDLDVEGPVRVNLSPEYSVQVFRFYAVTTVTADLSGPDSDGDLLSGLV